MVDSKRGRGLACTLCYAGVVVVVNKAKVKGQV